MLTVRPSRALFLLLLLAAPAARGAVTFTVDSADDGGDAAADGVCATAAGLCSLRAALAELEADPQGGTITFSLPAGTTITLSAPLGTVTRPLLLDGAGTPGLSVVRDLASASTSGGILALAPAAGAQVELRNLRLAGARLAGSGGAVQASSGSLRLSGVVFETNGASGDGGAISFEGGGTLAISGCAFSSNTAASGGAIRLAGGTLSLSSTLLYGNQATREGGALSLGGGASAALRGTTLVYNSAYQGASATRGGAIAVDHASASALLLRQVTVHANNARAGGGLSLGDTATAALENGVLAGNFALSAGQEIDCEGTVTSATHSLLGISGGSCAVAHGASGNLVGTAAAPIDPMVDHDGPGFTAATLYLPRLGSPLRDAGDPAICALADVALDPRGVARSPGNDGDGDGTAACDIGAAEAPVPGPPAILDFSANLTAIPEGNSTYLNWTATETLGCTLGDGSGSAPAAVAPQGNRQVTPAATTTYTLTCPGAGVSPPPAAVATVTVTVTPAPVVAITSFTAAPATVAPGGSSTLSLTYENASAGCTLSYGATSDYVPAYGSGASTVVVTPAATTTYTLSCPGNRGPATATVTVTVATSATVAITSFTATPGAIVAGGSSTLAWAVSGATSCEITGGAAPADAPPPAGSLAVSPTATTTYTLTCQGSGGPAATTATVTVTPQGNVAIATFALDAAAVDPGGSTTLRWSATDAAACRLAMSGCSWAPPDLVQCAPSTAPLESDVATSGTLLVGPSGPTLYTLTCQGAGGPASATAVLDVSAPEIRSFEVVALSGAHWPGQVGVKWQARWVSSCALLVDGAPEAVEHAGTAESFGWYAGYASRDYRLECTGPHGTVHSGTFTVMAEVGGEAGELGNQGLCSTAAGGGGSPASLLPLALVALGLVGRRRRPRRRAAASA